MKTTGTYATRKWVGIGVLCWTALAVTYTLSMGLRNISYGAPFLPAWWAITNALLMTLAGAVLTPLVLIAFRKRSRRSERRAPAVPWYIAIGLAYWVAWSAILAGFAAAGLIQPPGLTLPRALIAMAYISLGAYAVLVMLYEAVRSFSRARERELEAARLQTELSLTQAGALRARLNPDFLFDSFTTASTLMASDARAARRVLADLGALLRASLGQNGGDLISCQDEMELLQRFLDIQRARPGSGLKVKMEMEEAAATAVLPPLVLQPVVEELVRARTTPQLDDLRLEVSALRMGRDLRLNVIGTGSGLDTRAVSSTGGLDRTRARLLAVYGDRALVTATRPGSGGVRVVIHVPQPERDGTGE